MLLFDPTEPFAILDSCVPSFTARVVGKSIGDDRLASFFGQTEKRPTPFLVDDSGQTLAIDAARGGSSSRKMIAVVPLWGTLSPDGRYGGTSTKEFAKTVEAFANDSQIGAIVLRINSPGGTVTGTLEAGDAIRALRGNSSRPIVASVDSLMASAATWIGTAADEVAITPSGEAGSIGVISMYADWSKMYEEFGIKIDVMRTPAKKARFSGIEPMTDEMRATMTTRLAEAYDQFKRAMADNRKVRIDTIESKFGGGEMLNANEAISAGLVDKVASFDTVLHGLFLKMERKAPSLTRAQLAKAELDLLT